MKDERLYRLFKLHEIDEKLLGIKAKADNLDLGKRELAAIKKINADYADDVSSYAEVKKTIASERSKADQAQEKIKKFNKELFEGGLISTREAENLQKEIQMLEEIGLAAEMKVEELETKLVPLADKVAKIDAKISELNDAVSQKRARATTEHANLKVAFSEIGGTRAELESAIDLDVIKPYDSARKRTGTTGLALVTFEGRCGACGLPVAERTQENVRLGKVQQCESCRRVLFFREESPE